MRPLERRPGNDPGLPDCAAWACPLHSARMDGLACPGTPIGSRRRNTGGSGRAESDRPSGGTGDSLRAAGEMSQRPAYPGPRFIA